MSKMSTPSASTQAVSLVKAQNIFADCLIRQIRLFQISCTSIFGSATFCGFGFSFLKLTKIVYYHVFHVNRMFSE